MADKSSDQLSELRSASETDLGRGSDSSTHDISFHLPARSQTERSPPAKHRSSSSSYASPLRHHQRTPSRPNSVKETLDAHSHYGSGDENDGAAVHRINQYVIKQEIGRGSFGSVHLAVDQFGIEYILLRSALLHLLMSRGLRQAVKEFSKARLRKRAQSNLLRRPQPRRPGALGGRVTIPSAIHRVSSSYQEGDNNSLSLIKEEIAIMKKLNHNNLVALIEVLDDPDEDSLYMVLEICKKGVAMKVNLDEPAEPYDDETCRCWFRDMILGIEYLHAQGIIHRDIKPDNCLITNDDVLKIVDFGVSEMFEKSSDMATTKSAGSPAFMPPELCVAKHGPVSGRAADIWSMGVTLYCLRYGRLPFDKSSMLELYESIRTEDVPLNDEQDNNFADLMHQMLDKNPETRIAMDALREHPWVTKDGTDELLSASENCADLVELPTEMEKNHAITETMGNLLVVLKAAKRFKSALHSKRTNFLSMFDNSSSIVAPPSTIDSMISGSKDQSTPKSSLRNVVTPAISRIVSTLSLNEDTDDDDSKSADAKLDRTETDGIAKQREETQNHHPPSEVDTERHRHPSLDRERTHSPENRPRVNAEDHAKGHAHDPLEDHLYLQIGCDPNVDESGGDEDNPIVSQSPSGTDTDVYEQAYRDEMDRILETSGRSASMFSNRRVDHKEDIRLHSNICDAGKLAMRVASEKVSALSDKGYAAGRDAHDAGKDAALNAFNTLSSTAWRTHVDDKKQQAAEYATPAAKKVTDVFSGLFSAAQAKQQ